MLELAQHWDLIVVGGGTAGIVASKFYSSNPCAPVVIVFGPDASHQKR
jgi:thioredoxin reductase